MAEQLPEQAKYYAPNLNLKTKKLPQHSSPPKKAQQISYCLELPNF